MLEEEFRYQIQKQQQIMQHDNDDLNNLILYYEDLKQLIRNKKVKLKDEDEIPYHDKIQNLLKENQQSFYMYKKNNRFLHFDKASSPDGGPDTTQAPVNLKDDVQPLLARQRVRRMSTKEIIEDQLQKYSIFNQSAYLEHLSKTHKLPFYQRKNKNQINEIRKNKRQKELEEKIEHNKDHNEKLKQIQLLQIQKSPVKQKVKKELSKITQLRMQRNNSIIQNMATFRLNNNRTSVNSATFVINHQQKGSNNQSYTTNGTNQTQNTQQDINEQQHSQASLRKKSLFSSQIQKRYKSQFNVSSNIELEDEDDQLDLKVQSVQRVQSPLPNLIKTSTQTKTPQQTRESLKSRQPQFNSPLNPISFYKKNSIGMFSQKSSTSMSRNESQKKVKFLPETPKLSQLRDHIQLLKALEPPEPVKDNTKQEIKKKIDDLSDNIIGFQKKYKPENDKVDFRNKYALQMFEEDIRFENIKNSVKILDIVDHAKKAKFQKLLYFYHVNSLDEINSETKIIKNEVRMGMADPVRTAAIIELQNFIKKNVGKKQIMTKIANQSSKNMMVKSNNVSFEQHQASARGMNGESKNSSTAVRQFVSPKKNKLR